MRLVALLPLIAYGLSEACSCMPLLPVTERKERYTKTVFQSTSQDDSAPPFRFHIQVPALEPGVGQPACRDGQEMSVSLPDIGTLVL
jgi:hypothetical protein